MLGFAELMRVIDEGSLSGAAPKTTTAPPNPTASTKQVVGQTIQRVEQSSLGVTSSAPGRPLGPGITAADARPAVHRPDGVRSAGTHGAAAADGTSREPTGGRRSHPRRSSGDGAAIAVAGADARCRSSGSHDDDADGRRALSRSTNDNPGRAELSSRPFVRSGSRPDANPRRRRHRTRAAANGVRPGPTGGGSSACGATRGDRHARRAGTRLGCPGRRPEPSPDFIDRRAVPTRHRQRRRPMAPLLGDRPGMPVPMPAAASTLPGVNPADFPPWQAVYAFFERWAARGLPQRVVDRLRGQLRVGAGCAELPTAR